MDEKHKKILFVITKSNFGGAQRYVYDLASVLKNDFDVVVALGGEGELKSMLERAGIRVVPIPGLQRDISFTKELRSVWSLSAIIRSERPDILHLNSSKAGFLGAFVGRLHQVPRIIFTAHGWAFNEDRPAAIRFLFGLFHWLTILLAHHTICVSQGLQKEMHWPFTKGRMSVVHHGRATIKMLTREEARAQLTILTPKLRAYGNDIWIGTIAELHPIKQLDHAIEAVAHITQTHPNIRYVIIGDGEMRQKLAEQIQARKLSDCVYLVGSIPEAARFLKAFDLFVLPSRSESFGYVLIEAGQAGLPVVTTSVGGVLDIIENGVTGTLVPPESQRALTEALQLYLDDPSYATTHGQALEKAVEQFSIERMAGETRRIYGT